MNVFLTVKSAIITKSEFKIYPKLKTMRVRREIIEIYATRDFVQCIRNYIYIVNRIR